MRERIKLCALSALLSSSMISKPWSNSSKIDAQTKKRVRKVSVLTNYVPNHQVKDLKDKRVKTIGVIIPTIQTEFYSLALESMIKEANNNGYRIVASISDELVSREKENINFLIQRQVDGIVLSPSKETQKLDDLNHVNLLKQRKIPVVIFGRSINNLNCEEIGVDDFKEAHRATQNLIRSGRKNILYISGLSGIDLYEKRKNGFLNAVLNFTGKGNVLEYDSLKISSNELKYAIRSNGIDGILVSDELTAIQVIKNLLQWGYKIPKDISLIGFSAGIMEENYRSSLFAIDQAPTKQGSLAVKNIINRMENEITGAVISYKK
ncbi:LacI family DNA-binding transcriptional regulator [Salegentibacter sp. F188]|uniref:LacI family DNA-binding transcriptional regulator n=1 Tax=Autumnicola patrickiae TaxID=3075591 RepID=A0ABU3DYH5_9FLAO|nr:LacI family DNA-binding transcriptional regulator [Salegentibacter sp. F188]MDT0688771.1 LacI family DNA-binding transcriptional regulator [Salegentibacter sp. F188]